MIYRSLSVSPRRIGGTGSAAARDAAGFPSFAEYSRHRARRLSGHERRRHAAVG